MSENIIMARKIPFNACPCCGHRQFVVLESQMNAFLTGREGEIIDSKEKYYHAVGKCTNCKSEYDMINTINGFIPATKLRKLLYKYTTYDEDVIEESAYIRNPMEVNK